MACRLQLRQIGDVRPRAVRRAARSYYLTSGRPLECAVCGYSTHVEVCHLRALADFPADALVLEVNTLSNLVALCPNHHWELDHGQLERDQLAAIAEAAAEFPECGPS